MSSSVDRVAERGRGTWRVVVPLISAVAGLLFVASAVSADGTDLRSGSTDLEALVDTRADDVAALRGDVRDLQADIEQMSAGIGDAAAAPRAPRGRRDPRTLRGSPR